MALLYDQFGRPVETAKRPERRPLAAAPVNHSAREYIADGLTPATLATIFREADAGDMRRQAELFESLCEKDTHILGEITKRRQAIVDVEFRVRPASEDARDVRVAEFVQEILDNFTEDDDDLVALQHAVGNGYACEEIEWDVSSGQAVPVAFNWIEPARLLFTDPAGNLRRFPRLITDANMMGEEIPAWKTIFHSYGGKSGHPTRSGILRVCAWMYLFKNYAIKDWVTFAEIYGMPIRLGKYEPGASVDDRDALVTALRSIGTDAAGVISKSTEIEFVQAQGTATSADLYSALAGFCNKEISKALVGQTLTADVGDAGSYAAGKVHNEIRIDLAKADSRAVAVTRRHQLIRPLVGFNFGWDTPVPFYGPVWEEEEDLEKKATWVEKLINQVQVPASWLRREFGIPEPEEGEEMVGGPQAVQMPWAAAKAMPGRRAVVSKKTDPADEMQALSAMFERNAKNLPAPVVAAIRDLISTAPDLQSVTYGLENIAGTVDMTPAVEALQKAFAAAELAGRAAVLDEVGK